MDLYTLLEKCKIRFKEDKMMNHPINKICDHSKNIDDNDIFVAIKGEENDGHDYIVDAISKKIKTVFYEDDYYDYLHFEKTNMIKVHDTKKILAVLCHKFYDEPSCTLNLVGVTGTNGKTTVSSLIYQVYHLLEESCTLIGTNGIKIGKKEVHTHNTTPSAPILQKTLKQSLDEGISQVIMEVSSHAVKQERISQLDFNTAIFTNFSHDHLDYHKTFDDYFYSKGLLFAYLGNFLNGKKVLFNGDDKYYKKFMRLTNVESYTYGIGRGNDFQARDIVCDVHEISFQFYYVNDFIGTVYTNNIFGFFNVYNLLAALSYFYISEYDMEKIFTVFPKLVGVKGRMEKVQNPYDMDVFIDYAHTPDSVFRVLNEMKMVSKKNIIAVIGCGGDRDALKRPLIGKIATKLSDYVIFTTDNPRFEDPSRIIQDMVQGVSQNNYKVVEKRDDAISYAISMAGKNDVVMVLGKGHENYQIIKDKKIYFSDYDEVMKQIKNRFSKNE